MPEFSVKMMLPSAKRGWPAVKKTCWPSEVVLIRFIVVILYRGFKLLHAEVVPTEGLKHRLSGPNFDPDTDFEAGFGKNVRK